MNNHFRQKEELFKQMIDFGYFGSRENYSISDRLFRLLYEDKEISMDSYLESWNSFLKNKQGFLSLYIHIPYCVERCNYCYTTSKKWTKECNLEAYIKKIVNYLDFFENHFKGEVFDNLYIGGGDPGILSEDLLDKLLSSIFSKYNFLKEGQRTVENDPRTTSERKMKILKRHGINRLSIGIQTFDPEVLRLNNRIGQNSEMVEDVVKKAKDVNFKVLNLDLIIGLFGQDPNSIVNSFKKTIDLEPDEISLYPLFPLKGYLAKIYDKTRPEFFEKRADLYREVGSKIFEIANERGYLMDEEFLESKNRTDADSIAIKKDNSYNFKTSYVANTRFNQNSILGIGEGAGSSIFKELTCTALEGLTKDPNDYCFHGRRVNEDEELVKYIVTNISCSTEISVKDLNNQFSEKSVDRVMKTFRNLEKVGVINLSQGLIRFNFKNPKESLLYSLFFFDELSVVGLLEKEPTEFSKEEVPKKTPEKLKKKINKIGNDGILQNIDGSLLEKKEDEIIVETKKGTRSLSINSETLFVVSWLDEENDYKLISHQPFSLKQLKEGADLSLKANKKSGVLKMVQNIKVIEA